MDSRFKQWGFRLLALVAFVWWVPVAYDELRTLIGEHGWAKGTVRAFAPAVVWMVILYVAGRLAANYRERFYRPSPSDLVLFRFDQANEPLFVLREDRLFLFRGVKPDVLRRHDVTECSLGEDGRQLFLRIADRSGKAFRYYLNVSADDIDVGQAQRWL